LDVTPILTVDLNASKQITSFRPPHSNGPFSFPFGMPSLDFESVCPLHFTPTCPIPFVLSYHRPFGWHYTTLPLSWPSIVKERVDDAPPSSLCDPKGVQRVGFAELVRNLVPFPASSTKRGRGVVLEAPGLD
jgi:hypothetical protein